VPYVSSGGDRHQCDTESGTTICAGDH